MYSTNILPAEFTLFKEVDLSKNKKIALWLNLASIMIGLGVFLMGFLWEPLDIDSLLGFTGALPCLVLFPATLLYIILHEIVHGICIKAITKQKPHYGFKGLYAFCGKRDSYFSGKAYAVIALAPVVVFGVIFIALSAFLSGLWFWFAWLLLTVNLSGAAGDIYVMYILYKTPKGTLVNDDGVSMRFYSASQN